MPLNPYRGKGNVSPFPFDPFTTSVALDQKLKPPLRSSSLLRKVKGNPSPLTLPLANEPLDRLP